MKATRITTCGPPVSAFIVNRRPALFDLPVSCGRVLAREKARSLDPAFSFLLPNLLLTSDF